MPTVVAAPQLMTSEVDKLEVSKLKVAQLNNQLKEKGQAISGSKEILMVGLDDAIRCYNNYEL